MRPESHKRSRSIARVSLLAILMTAGACYDSRFEDPPVENNRPTVTSSIAELKSRFVGTPFVVSGDISLQGRVISSDRAGNFYRTISIQQDRAALEIMAGIDQLHNQFPIGCSVTLYLEGLLVSENLGVIRVGNPPQPGSGYATDYIGSRAALEKVLVRNAEDLLPPEPFLSTIPELSFQSCGTLTRVENLRYSPETEEETGWSGYRQFVDPEGNAIYSYVRDYADFASDPIPSGVVTLVGILQYDDTGDGRFLLKLRDGQDCIH